MVEKDTKKLIKFLEDVKNHGYMASRNESGKIIYADDQYVNR